MSRQLYKSFVSIFIALLFLVGISLGLSALNNSVSYAAPTDTVDLTMHQIGMGTITPTVNSYSYERGTQVSLFAQPAVYWEFEGWSGDLITDTAHLPLIMDSDKEITATFRRKQTYTLTVNTVGNGSINLDPSGQSLGENQYEFLENTLVTMTAIASDSWDFGGWANVTGTVYLNPPSIQVVMDGNKSATATFEEKNYVVFLPLVLKNYKPFSNGDFESGNFDSWMQLQGNFNEHGTGLTQLVTNNVAELGNPAYSNNAIPVGYGAIAQTFTVQKRYLSFDYSITTYDIVKSTAGYYDTFEISVVAPDEVVDIVRDNKCISSPSGEISVLISDSLILCDGHYGVSDDVGTLYDSGNKHIKLDLAEWEGKNITLYFSVWSREYQSTYWNDKGWYNTWIHIDNIQESD